MGERKGQNKYYPPDYDPKKGGLNKWQGTHALRERARKLHLGILIIRFEMPFNVWCEGCGNHVGMGVRYNAEKKKVDDYYTTPIYEFKMKCHLCTNHFIIRTDPKNFDYELVEGLRRQEKRWDMASNEQIASTERETGKRLVTDAMFKLEHGEMDLAKAKEASPELQRLETFQQRWKDDFARNQELRKIFRGSKKEAKEKDAADEALLKKSSLSIKLLPENEDDKYLASLFSQYKTTQTSEEKQRQIVEELDKESVFRSRRKFIKKCPSDTLPDNRKESRQELIRNVKLATERKKASKLDQDLKKFAQKNLTLHNNKRPKLSTNEYRLILNNEEAKSDGAIADVKEEKSRESDANDVVKAANSSLALLTASYRSSSDSESVDSDGLL